MKCLGCNNENAYRLFGTSKYIKELQRYDEWCDKCGSLGSFDFPDVTVSKPYYDEHLGCEITSKRQKAKLLKEKGWRECGDRINPALGRPAPDMSKWSDGKRRKFYKDNYGG